jgi:hypothetical protein
MRILHLTLKKQWFDAILYGDKLEEYREIKPYWIKRLVERVDHELGFRELNATVVFKDFDIIRFKHGYAKDAVFFDIQCKGIRVGEGRSEWGAEPGKEYFVLKLEKF